MCPLAQFEPDKVHSRKNVQRLGVARVDHRPTDFVFAARVNSVLCKFFKARTVPTPLPIGVQERKGGVVFGATTL